MKQFYMSLDPLKLHCKDIYESFFPYHS